MAEKEQSWTEIYETKSSLDADLIRTSLEVAGYEVSVTGGGSTARVLGAAPAAFVLSVPSDDADDARDFLRDKMTLPQGGEMRSEDTSVDQAEAETSDEPQTESIDQAAAEVLDLRRQHHVAACKYCGIPTLDVREATLESHVVALVRAAGLGVNSATFSEFREGERICSACSGHEVTCDLCGRTLDAFLDEGEYRQVNDDEAYVCVSCKERVEAALENDRDW
jgi:hypothetical protein